MWKPVESNLPKPPAHALPRAGERLTWILGVGLLLYFVPVAFEVARAYLTGGELPELLAEEMPQFAQWPGLHFLYWFLLG